MAVLGISKSQYIKGLQCPKALWLYRYHKDLSLEPTPDKQATFDTGHEVGQLAMQYFGQGIEVDNEYWDMDGANEVTQQYIKDGHGLIFEATAIHSTDKSYARIDILKRVDGTDEWDLIEVKGSTSVKDYHVDDMSFQYHVFCGAGYKIRKCFMMVLDNTYVRQRGIEPEKLFKLEDISASVIAKQGEVQSVAGQLGYILEGKTEPDISIGARCFKPFECEYKSYCWKHVPDYSIYDIFEKTKAEKLSRQHGVEIEKLPDNIRPTGVKAIDIQSYLNKETIVNPIAINEFLERVKYPLYYLDYETISSAIPMFDGTRPFQQIPFQFSLHIQHEPDGELVHHEFLHKEQTDPRKAFTETLISLCGDKGTILVYNQSFEIARNNELSRDFPEYTAAIQAINSRVVDLLDPFKKRWLYHPIQHSSASIKAVLPCFTDLSYKDLEISNGGEAMSQYKDFIAGKIPKNQLDNLWQNLSAYCDQDTYAMVLLVDVLRKKVRGE